MCANVRLCVSACPVCATVVCVCTGVRMCRFSCVYAHGCLSTTVVFARELYLHGMVGRSAGGLYMLHQPENRPGGGSLGL